jgi:hypothetical protein
MSYTVLSTQSSTQADSSSQTTTDSLTAALTQTLSYQGPTSGGGDGSQANWVSTSEQDTLTNTNNSTVSNNQTYSLYEGGGYGGGSWVSAGAQNGSPALVVKSVDTAGSSPSWDRIHPYCLSAIQHPLP